MRAAVFESVRIGSSKRGRWRFSCECSNFDFMDDYKTPTTEVLSLRISSDLLQAVRERAKADGRSVSKQIVSLLQEQMGGHVSAALSRPISGWLSHIESPETLAEFRLARRSASAALIRSVRKRRRA